MTNKQQLDDDYTDNYDAFDAYKRIYIDKKGVPKEWLEKHYKGHGLYGYGNELIARHRPL
tara:strand:+ start:1371 stop:1550 length:180 start_codon:yes stop_codon:yes gene_type:complete